MVSLQEDCNLLLLVIIIVFIARTIQAKCFFRNDVWSVQLLMESEYI